MAIKRDQPWLISLQAGMQPPDRYSLNHYYGLWPEREGLHLVLQLRQFRADETERMEAVSILQQLGLDMPSYLRMCVSRLVSAKGIPFSMTINQSSSNRGIEAMKRASRIAEENGISDMSLDEINAEIADARK